MVDHEGNMQLMLTVGGVLQAKRVNKLELFQEFAGLGKEFAGRVRQCKPNSPWGAELDVNENPNCPCVIQKRKKPERDDNNNDNDRFDQFETTVFTCKAFEENRPTASTEKVIQRFVFSRNMKAMVVRLCYDSQHYSAYRFQNIASLFKKPSSVHCTVQASPAWVGQVECSRLGNECSLGRYVEQSDRLKRYIERSEKVTVQQLYVDFVLDVLDQVWLINLKYIQLQSNAVVHLSKHITQSVATCRLCLLTFPKAQLTQSVSSNMYLQFLTHLSKRTARETLPFSLFDDQPPHSDYEILAVCGCCSLIIVHEIELIKWQDALARICHIPPQPHHCPSAESTVLELKQWRIMVYFESVKNFLAGGESFVVRYSLGRGVEQRWKCSRSSGEGSGSWLQVNKVRVHYLFSEGLCIDDYLTSTELSVSILSVGSQGEELIAMGSTAMVSNFKNKFEVGSGQRQSATILLFFVSRKYCELGLKLGIVCDGTYRTNTPLTKLHGVYLPSKHYVNSNPLPKEWMEIFGQTLTTHQTITEILSKPSLTHSKLKRKPILR